MRAIVINLVGRDGRRAKVVFDRYGMNSGVFAPGRTDEQIIAQATSNALGAMIQSPDHGPDRTADYSVTTVA